jgi:hypothetical protein
VEEVLNSRLAAQAEWQANGALHVLQHLPAFRRIASTGQIVPFNGLGGVYGRQRDRKALIPPHKGVDGGVHLPTTYGDGSDIPHVYLERLLEISDEIGFLVPWQEGDVAVLNNYTVQVSVKVLCRPKMVLSNLYAARPLPLDWGEISACQLMGWSR